MRVEPYELRLLEPVRGVRTRRGFVVTLQRGRLTGFGEACIAPEVGTEDAETCLAELRSGEPRTPAAKHALEQARLDLDAQEAGVPLAKLLEESAALSVECSALLAAPANAELAREASRAVAEGFRTVKLKGCDFARVAVVRDAAGPTVKVRLDANGALPDAATALRALREVAPLGVELCEQPTADLCGLAGAAVPIAADELVVSDFTAALQRASVVVLKPMALGGILRALELARRARAAGLGVIVTTSLDGAIARAGATHLAAAVGSDYAHGLATGRLLESDLCAGLEPHAGRIALRAVPGLGVRP